MAKPYSNDLRQKVIDAIELNGMKRCEVAELFGISRNSINLWFNRKVQTGTIEPKKREKQGHSHKITDGDEFRYFVKKIIIKLKRKWLSSGLIRFLDGRLVEGLKRLDLRAKSGQTPRRRQAQGNADQDRKAMGIGKEMRKSEPNLEPV